MVMEEVMAMVEVVAEVDEMIPDIDQTPVMVVDTAEEDTHQNNAQHGVKNAESVERKTTLKISADLTDHRVVTTIRNRTMTKVKANATSPSSTTENSMMWLQMMVLMTGMKILVNQEENNLKTITMIQYMLYTMYQVVTLISFI